MVKVLMMVKGRLSKAAFYQTLIAMNGISAENPPRAHERLVTVRTTAAMRSAWV